MLTFPAYTVVSTSTNLTAEVPFICIIFPVFCSMVTAKPVTTAPATTNRKKFLLEFHNM
jgi:hypothetical protein